MLNRPPKTLIIGERSFIGNAFLSAYRQFYPDTIGTHHFREKGKNYLDLSDPNLSSLNIKPGEYSNILVSAGCTNPAFCEGNKEYSQRCNVYGVLQLVKQAVELGMFPIIFSSTYVFDGVQGNYTETSRINPINEYGKQKALLEKEIEKLCKNQFLILRCDKVFDLDPSNNTLLYKIYSRFLKNQKVFAAKDRIFSPILLQDVIQVIMALQKNKCKGLYNLCGEKPWSWLDLAKIIAAQMKMPSSLIVPVLLSEIPSSYKIPKRTDCRCNKLKNIIDYKLRSLPSCVRSIERHNPQIK